MPEAKRILIAEDEQSISLVLKNKLARLGYDVLVATNGEDALKMIALRMPDLVLLDLIMPVMDGFQVLEKLQSEGKLLKIIVFSNLGQDGDVKRATELGAIDYAIKSNMSIKDVVSKVENTIGKP
jgi:CheY-like chemotaxis protein